MPRRLLLETIVRDMGFKALQLQQKRLRFSRTIIQLHDRRLIFHFQAQRLFRDRLADSESRTRFDGMLNAQLRASWGHTATLNGVRLIYKTGY